MIAPRALEEHLSPEAAAERLGVSLSTMRRWIRSGEIRPVFKPTRRNILIPASAVVRFLNRSTFIPAKQGDVKAS